MNPQRSVWLASKVARLLLLGLLVSGLGAQESENTPLTGYPEDWTHHRIKFTLPGLQAHPEIASREPRAMHALYRRWQAYQVPITTTSLSTNAQTAAVPTSAPDWNVSLGSATVQAGQYPAKWTLNINAAPSCTNDYVIFGLNAPGSPGGQATLVGFNNLYSGAAGALCPGGGPTVKFSYYTSSNGNGRIQTSPVLSLNGTQIAFVESNPGGRAVLHVLTLGTTGTNGTSVTASVNVGPLGGNNAVLVSLTYGGTAGNPGNNTRSSPWVDYPSNILYVGDDRGRLHKFINIFKITPTTPTPTEVTTGGWPIVIQNGIVLTGPVFDNSTGWIYIGGSTGRLYAANVNTPAAAIKILAVGAGGAESAIFDSPIFDGFGNVLVTTANDGTANNGATIVQATAVGSPGTTITQKARIHIGRGCQGIGGCAIQLHDGEFDNNYFTNPLTGHMYVCGTGPDGLGGANPYNVPNRYALDFGFDGTIFSNGGAAIAIGNAGAACSPFTEFFNPNIGGGTDFIFYGVSSCSGSTSGCIRSIQQVGTAPATFHSQPLTWAGTSGIVIDNDFFQTGLEQTSSIYFGSQSGNRAVKLTQLNLN